MISSEQRRIRFIGLSHTALIDITLGLCYGGPQIFWVPIQVIRLEHHAADGFAHDFTFGFVQATFDAILNPIFESWRERDFHAFRVRIWGWTCQFILDPTKSSDA